MDLTQGTTVEKQKRAKKTMMWFAMVSMTMTFAGLTSAYVVSKTREDWLTDLVFPDAFITSVLIIIVSSVAFYFVKIAIEKGNRSLATILLLTTLSLGILFVFMQFQGFEDIMGQGYYFTGPSANIVPTFLYIIVVLHIVHVIVGLIVLLVVIYNHFKQKYKRGQTLGLELGAMYWHFVDVLWVYLFLFLYFVR
ncbi:heme-copper oxidase subunit III [Aquimarina sp. BL5]|uniref:cytochrome c oxidase subunit 3 n=1 Tax=Aquimarina sp. BL5 TaxID=1714860 RepID=UPI000E507DBF|nr:cytochrome c oxidase subunit 3 [Aquimarina sp. BL5]AXT51414.1 heme-copper oxidase subunit III [Aquimarina sp. BL5]RKN10694.1 heme-copper oxidase subunit III [Aquimarina sp. BL5]